MDSDLDTDVALEGISYPNAKAAAIRIGYMLKLALEACIVSNTLCTIESKTNRPLCK